MKKKVVKAISEHRLFSEGDTVIVAVSGGADSVALLDVLASLEELHLRLVVAHLNHTLRGSESDEDETFVRQLAGSYGLPVEIARVDVKGLGLANKVSIEEAGRGARYDFFSDVARKYGAQAIATAHHADDQAETVLMRLLRGTGAAGLCAISPKSGGNLVRPLLTVTRHEIETYLRCRRLSNRIDSSNADTGFLRNRIRHELIPYLETYNPAVRDRLVATAEALARDEDLMEGTTDLAFARHGGNGDGAVTLDATGCAAEPAGVRFRLYRRAILLAKGDLERVYSVHLQNLDLMVFSRKPHMSLYLPDGLKVTKSYAVMSFVMASARGKSAPWEMPVAGPGAYNLPGGYRLVVEEGLPPEKWDGLSPNIAYIDHKAGGFPWLIRPFKAGDRMVPLGMTGHKKVKDIFIDEKVPIERRRRIPLVFSGERLLWVSSLRLSAEAAVTRRSKKVIRAEILDMYSLMGL